MAGNSFTTHDGTHVTGAVAMAVDEDGKAVPIEADTPIGRVALDFTFEEFCRALAAHAAIVAGKGDAAGLAQHIVAFARKDQP